MPETQTAPPSVGRELREQLQRVEGFLDGNAGGLLATGRKLRDAIPPSWRSALFILFIAGILAYGAAYLLAKFDLVNLIRDVNTDDSFYYFQIAWNMAEGRFSTFDGGITRTNGYHPLWLFLITPFYWVFDKETALFGIKAFEIMLVAGGVAPVVAAARLARPPCSCWGCSSSSSSSTRGTPSAGSGHWPPSLSLSPGCASNTSPSRWQPLPRSASSSGHGGSVRPAHLC